MASNKPRREPRLREPDEARVAWDSINTIARLIAAAVQLYCQFTNC